MGPTSDIGSARSKRTSGTQVIDRDNTWCEALERLLRQHRIRLRYRRSAQRGVLYACDRPGSQTATVWVPRGAIAAGVYGLRAALAEIEEALISLNALKTQRS